LKKVEKMGWFWFVGFGDLFEGRRERELKLIVLQTFPPNPFF
jgi:hypothetical protein